jgi:hypothetical protein
MNRRFLILLTSVTVFFACNRKGCTDPLAINYEEKAKKDDGSCIYYPQTEVTVHFNHIFNSQTLNSSVFDDLIYSNAAGTVLSVSKLKYHISDFRFYKTNGDSLMTDEYHFVDLSQKQRGSAAARDAHDGHDLVPRIRFQNGGRAPAERRGAAGIMVPCPVIGQDIGLAKQIPPLAKRTGQVAAWIEGTDEGTGGVVSHVTFRSSMKGLGG